MRIIGLLILFSMLLLPVGVVMGDDNSLELKNVPKVIESLPANDINANVDKLTQDFKESMSANDIKAKADKLTHEFKVLQENNKFYECVVLTIGVILSLVVVLYFVTRSRYTTTHIVHASGLVLIVFGTIYVIILSDSDAHITGTMGVLGATAGYLFGSMGKGVRQNQPDEK